MLAESQWEAEQARRGVSTSKPMTLLSVLRAYEKVLHSRGISADDDTYYYRLLLKLSLEDSHGSWFDRLQRQKLPPGSRLPAPSFPAGMAPGSSSPSGSPAVKLRMVETPPKRSSPARNNNSKHASPTKARAQRDGGSPSSPPRFADDPSGMDPLAIVRQSLWTAIHHRRTLFGRECWNVRSFFKAVDKDGSRIISKSELRQALQRLDVPVSLEQLEALLSTIDTDGSDGIDFLEFERWMNGWTVQQHAAHRSSPQRRRHHRRRSSSALDESSTSSISTSTSRQMASPGKGPSILQYVGPDDLDLAELVNGRSPEGGGGSAGSRSPAEIIHEISEWCVCLSPPRIRLFRSPARSACLFRCLRRRTYHSHAAIGGVTAAAAAVAAAASCYHTCGSTTGWSQSSEIGRQRTLRHQHMVPPHPVGVAGGRGGLSAAPHGRASTPPRWIWTSQHSSTVTAASSARATGPSTHHALLKSTYGICLRLTSDGDDPTHMCLYGDGSSSFYGADLRNGLHAREWRQQQATTPTQLESESLSPPRVVDVQPAPLLPPLFSFLLSCLAFYLIFFLFSPFFSEGLSAFCVLVSPHSVPFYTHSCRTKSVSSVC